MGLGLFGAWVCRILGGCVCRVLGFGFVAWVGAGFLGMGCRDYGLISLSALRKVRRALGQ